MIYPESPPPFNPVSNVTSNKIQDAKKPQADQFKATMIATIALRKFVKRIQQKKNPFDANTVKTFNNLIYNLYISKVELTENKENVTVKRQLKIMDISMGLALKILLPGTENKQIKAQEISFIFDKMMESILSGVDEEVVGQERPPRAIPQLLNTAMKEKFGKALTSQMMKIAAMLYPIALLSASLDPRSSVPSVGNEKNSLSRDRMQFIKEYRSQFGNDCFKGWSVNCFGGHLQAIWNQRRGAKQA